MSYLLLLLLALTLPCSSAHAIPAYGQKLMISGPDQDAVQAGLEIARQGGNVVDVAVATELALAVTKPYFASLGGGGFALIKLAGRIDALDFRETAPLATNPHFYDTKPVNAAEDGGTAVGIPGLPAGLRAMHEKYGKLPWQTLFKPALRLAEKGFQVTEELSERTATNRKRMNETGKKIFARSPTKASEHDSTLRPGDLLKEPQLAKLLTEFKLHGPRAFYEQAGAKDIIDSVTHAGGVITAQDLHNYHVRWLKPLAFDRYGYHFNIMPPPSSGGVVIQTALALSEMKQLETKPPQSAEELHMIAEILRASFRSRQLLGDPDFVTNPLERLLSPSYFTELAAKIKDHKRATWDPLEDPTSGEPHETTHFSVMDRDGNTVAMTVTLNGNYGSGVVSERFGVVLNNEMDDFTTHPDRPNQFGLIQGRRNLVQPNKRPLSSMSPTIVEKDGKTVMSLGSPGGPRIISAVYQVLYRALVSHNNMDEAIQCVRVHHQFKPDIVYIDPHRVSPDVITTLTSWGDHVEQEDVARVYGILMNKDQLLEGAFDSRGEGFAAGY